MKKGILLVMFALLSLAGFSQVSWNAKVGMNISNFTGDLDVSAKVGVKLGVGMEYAFNDTWLLQPSLFLSQKGAKFSATVSGNEAEVKFNAMYFELPIMAAARFNVANNTNIVSIFSLWSRRKNQNQNEYKWIEDGYQGKNFRK